MVTGASWRRSPLSKDLKKVARTLVDASVSGLARLPQQCPQTGSFYNENLFLTALEVGSPNQGVSGFGFFLSFSPGLADACPLPVSSQDFSSEHTWVLISSYEDTNFIGREPTLLTPFYLFKGLISKYRLILMTWGLKHQHTNFEGSKSAHNTGKSTFHN